MAVRSAFPISAVLPFGFDSSSHFSYLFFFFSERCMCLLFNRPCLFGFGRLLLMHLQFPFRRSCFFRIGRILLQWSLRTESGLRSKLFFFVVSRSNVSGRIPPAIIDAPPAIFVVIRSNDFCSYLQIVIWISKTRISSPYALFHLILFRFSFINVHKKLMLFPLSLYDFTNTKRFVAMYRFTTVLSILFARLKNKVTQLLAPCFSFLGNLLRRH